MVTIEQKLTLFSKLLQQDIKNEIGDKVVLIEEEFAQKQREHNEAVDKEAKLIVDKATKRAEHKKTELISKARMQAKKEIMGTKEKCVNQCIRHLEERVRMFVQSDAYEGYLLSHLENIKEISDIEAQVIIYMTEVDKDKYGTKVLEKAITLGLKREQVSVESSKYPMIGGYIIEVPEESIRMDLCMRTVIEDHRGLIIERVFEAIEQVGEVSE